MEETQKLPPPVTLRDVLLILKRRISIALFTCLTVIVVTLFATAQMKTVYESKARVLTDRPTDYAIPNSAMDLLTGSRGNPLNTEIEKIRARPFIERVLQSAGQKDADPEDFLNRLKLAAVGDQILEILVRAETAEEAQKLTNTVAEIYIVQARVEYDDRIDVTQERLIEARDKAKKEKQDAEAELSAFDNKIGVSDPSLLFRERTAQTVAARNELEMERKNLELLYKSLADLQKQIQTIPKEIVGGYSLNKNPVIDNYRVEIAGLEAKRKTMLFDFAPESEEIKAVDNEIAAKREAITKAEKSLYSTGSKGISRNPDYAKFQTQIHDTEYAIAHSTDKIASQEKRVDRLEAEQKQLTLQQNVWEGLKRKRDSANEVYEQARLGLLKMEATGPMSAPVIKVLDAAQKPKQPISPKPLLNLIMAISLGLFLGGGMALLAEYMASGGMGAEVYDPDLPLIGGIPLLGSVPVALPAPSEKSGLPALVGNAPVATIDSLREIGFTLANRHPGEPIPVILLSGTRSDDTTAALAAQLTATLVRDGLRVTLVDADRANPRLNRVFGKPDAPGLSDVLAGRVKAKEILYVGANTNLRFMAAGATDDPTPMSEAGLRKVFKELAGERETDLVVVSGPTVWHASLIAPLEKAATGTVLVAPETADGAPPAESVARARRLLSNGYKPRLLGVVIGFEDSASEMEREEVTG